MYFLEPDAWTNIGYRITASQHANDYRLLHTILNQYSQWKNSTVIGPSTTGSQPSFNYLKK